MALIHEKLYTTKDFTKVSFDSYLKELSQNIISSYELKNTRINYSFDLDEVYLTLDQAIPCGLIINELISNILKYAFEGKKEGNIFIKLKEEEKRINIELNDDGVGIPDVINIKETETLGLQLVNTLVEQLKGELELKREKGSSFSINFNRFE